MAQPDDWKRQAARLKAAGKLPAGENASLVELRRQMRILDGLLKLKSLGSLGDVDCYGDTLRIRWPAEPALRKISWDSAERILELRTELFYA